MGRTKPRYNLADVAEYWSQRLARTDPLAAVLTFDAPAIINEAYHSWELGALKTALGSKARVRLSGKSALDIACGTGRITRLLAESGAKTTAIDLSPAMLTAGRRKCAGLGVVFARASADDLPFADRSFDIITCFGLLEHLPRTPRTKCVAEVARLLRAKGRAYFVVNNADCIFLNDRVSSVPRAGYHVELVGLEWLERSARSHGGSIAICAANSGYAVAHYQMNWRHRRSSEFARRQRATVAVLQQLDHLIPPDSLLARMLASHFMVEFSLSS